MRLLFISLLAVCRVVACSCIGGGNPCADAAKPGTAVFIGVVVRGDEGGSARVRIVEALRDVPGGLAEADVYTMRGTSCHQPLAVGQRWLFVTSQPYSVGGCSSSFLLAGNEHKLQVLRDAIRSGSRAVAGTVVDPGWKPLAGIPVELTSTAGGPPSATFPDARAGIALRVLLLAAICCARECKGFEQSLTKLMSSEAGVLCTTSECLARLGFKGG